MTNFMEDRPTAAVLLHRITTAISEIDRRYNVDLGANRTADNADDLPTVPTTDAQNQGCCVVS